MKVLTVVGARPQFIKAAVVSRALQAEGVREVVVHTGQHYDDRLSAVFFRELGMRDPAYNLGVGSASHAVQTAQTLSKLEPVIATEGPDRLLVYGDTNSTLAGALAAVKLHIPVDHVEAGLRSFDRDMPEEINRVLTDHVADLLFCPTATAMRNLACEGLQAGVLHVGDVMLDLALETRARAEALPLPAGVAAGDYFLATVHRASNTDYPERLHRVARALVDVATHVGPVVLAAHPRLASRLAAAGADLARVHAVPPLGYLEMQALILHARGVITDSGGVQKEAFFHGVPCVTLRDSTEWVESVEAGMNTLVGDSLERVAEVAARCAGHVSLPPEGLAAFGGGDAAARVARALREAGVERRRWQR